MIWEKQSRNPKQIALLETFRKQKHNAPMFYREQLDKMRTPFASADKIWRTRGSVGCRREELHLQTNALAFSFWASDWWKKVSALSLSRHELLLIISKTEWMCRSDPQGSGLPGAIRSGYLKAKFRYWNELSWIKLWKVIFYKSLWDEF